MPIRRAHQAPDEYPILPDDKPTPDQIPVPEHEPPIHDPAPPRVPPVKDPPAHPAA